MDFIRKSFPGKLLDLIMYRRFGKILLDYILTIGTLPFAVPLMGFIAFFVWVKLGSPILFRQERPGLGEKPFILYKFRTMNVTHDLNGNLLPDTERLTIFGKFLRMTSLDELPELINVLRGEMSLVGPRPLLQRYMPFFTYKEKIRFRFRPGITGLSQILGRNELSWDTRLAIDVDYVESCSLLLDIRILLLTIWRVIMHKGLRVDPSSIMLDLDTERGKPSLISSEKIC